MKKILSLILVVALATMLATAAKPNFSEQENNGGHTFSIPSHAKEVAPGVYDLGTIQEDGRTLQGYAFVRYKKGFHHRDGHGGGPPGSGGGGGDDDTTTSDCFEVLSKDAEWKNVEDYMVDPTNNAGLDETTVQNILAESMEDWEVAAGTEVFGTQKTGNVDGIDQSSTDGKNEVLFGDVDSEGAIAVTITWGIFRGPPSQRELVEWDQLYDDVDFDWSSTGEAGKMDFHNIAAHELGHALGLGHPSDSCIEETMYAFADYGETNKRDLHDGDIAGAQQLY